jgi:hypothetical protein
MTEYSLDKYDSGTLFVRKDYLPLIVYLGKKEYSYWLTMPPSDNNELRKKFYTWFHNDFVAIVDHIVKKRGIVLDNGQERPSKAGGKYGWYLPLAVVLEVRKMWREENVPLQTEVLRPTDLIYGKGWTKKDITNVIAEYLTNNPSIINQTPTK